MSCLFSSAGAYAEFLDIQGKKIANEFIVTLSADSNSQTLPKDEFIAKGKTLAAQYQGRVLRNWSHIGLLHMSMDENDARRLALDPNVKYISPNVLESMASTKSSCEYGSHAYTTQVVASPQIIDCQDPNPQVNGDLCYDNWGLDRIDQKSSPRNGLYSFSSTGNSVHVYVVDSGLDVNHAEFNGRIGNGHVAYNTEEAMGECSLWPHGTHVAGVIAGTTFGVAKQATIHPVRVLNYCAGINEKESVIYAEAFNWISENHISPAVVNMSINAASVHSSWITSSQFADVVSRLAKDKNIITVNSAGNNKQHACGYTVSAGPDGDGVVVVGGINEFDEIWERNYSGGGSNYGSCVDVWAPAAHITSAWYDGYNPDLTCGLSGTSFAAAHVTGAIALYLQQHPEATANEVRDAIINAATTDALIGNLGHESPNRLVFTGNSDFGWLIPIITMLLL